MTNYGRIMKTATMMMSSLAHLIRQGKIHVCHTCRRESMWYVIIAVSLK